MNNQEDPFKDVTKEQLDALFEEFRAVCMKAGDLMPVNLFYNLAITSITEALLQIAPTDQSAMYIVHDAILKALNGCSCGKNACTNTKANNE